MRPREAIAGILQAALQAIDPEAAVRRSLRLVQDDLILPDGGVLSLDQIDRIWVAGAGKAAIAMSRGALDLLGDRICGGAISVPSASAAELGPLQIWHAGHPVPDIGSLAGAAEALRIARLAGERDLILCLLSGGASALWCAPPTGVPLSDLQALTRTLLTGGVPIAEMNTVRKHLSGIAGGGLARAAAPARLITLAISDVAGAPPHVIGSGPTLPDPSHYSDALHVLARSQLDAPASIRHHLRAGELGIFPETLEPRELAEPPLFWRIASLNEALNAAAAEAEALGIETTMITAELSGEAREVGAQLADRIRAVPASDRPRALLLGGETTVRVRGLGRGGRNQEVALSAAIALEGVLGVTVACFGTDGVDGPTDAAGAVIDGGTVARAREGGLDALSALERNDSYTLLSSSRDLIRCGPTGTNVGDLIVALLMD